MILEQETFDAFGYYPSALKPQSDKCILAVCDDCGKARVTSKHHYHILCNSCSQKGRTSEEASAWRGGPSERVCRFCNKTFFTPQCAVKNGDGNYCSKSCSAKARKCEKAPNWQGGPVERICKVCGKIFYARRDREGNYCSNSCRAKAKTGEESPSWRGGISFEPYCIKFNNAYKEYIRELFERKCFLCGVSKAPNGRKLDVHHVNYNKDCGCDNTKCICVPLCRSCHSKTNGNREYWQEMIMLKLKNSLAGWL